MSKLISFFLSLFLINRFETSTIIYPYRTFQIIIAYCIRSVAFIPSWVWYLGPLENCLLVIRLSLTNCEIRHMMCTFWKNSSPLTLLVVHRIAHLNFEVLGNTGLQHYFVGEYLVLMRISKANCMAELVCNGHCSPLETLYLFFQDLPIRSSLLCATNVFSCCKMTKWRVICRSMCGTNRIHDYNVELHFRKYGTLINTFESHKH